MFYLAFGFFFDGEESLFCIVVLPVPGSPNLAGCLVGCFDSFIAPFVVVFEERLFLIPAVPTPGSFNVLVGRFDSFTVPFAAVFLAVVFCVEGTAFVDFKDLAIKTFQ